MGAGCSLRRWNTASFMASGCQNPFDAIQYFQQLSRKTAYQNKDKKLHQPQCRDISIRITDRKIWKGEFLLWNWIWFLFGNNYFSFIILHQSKKSDQWMVCFIHKLPATGRVSECRIASATFQTAWMVFRSSIVVCDVRWPACHHSLQQPAARDAGKFTCIAAQNRWNFLCNRNYFLIIHHIRQHSAGHVTTAISGFAWHHTHDEHCSLQNSTRQK